MYFKATFLNPINEEEAILDSIDYNFQTGKEIVKFMSHEFEIVRDGQSLISELTFCNQCVNTYDIENAFITLLIKLSDDEQQVTLFDSDGSNDVLTRAELEEILN